MNALMRFAIASVLVFSMGTCTLLAQSLADVARETRNAPHARAKKVVTNDEIPSVDTMNTASAPAKDSTGAADDKAKAETKAGTNLKTPESGSAGNAPATKDGDQKKSEAAVNDKYLQQQEKISLLERELKVSEQEYRQKQLAHLADANARVNNQQQYAEAEKLDEDDIAQKKEKLNAERQKLADMQEDARHAGVKLPE